MNDISYKYISGKITEVGSNEDCDYWVVGDVTELQALKAIHRYEREECGLSGDELFGGDLKRVKFYEGYNEYEGQNWIYWIKQNETDKFIGWGWHGSL